MLKGFRMAPDYVSLARTNKNDSESIKCTYAFVHSDKKIAGFQHGWQVDGMQMMNISFDDY